MNVPLFGNRVFTDDQVKKFLGSFLIQYDCVLIKREDLDTERDTQEEHHVKTGFMMPQPRNAKNASKPAEARGESWNRFSLLAVRRIQPCQHLDLSFLGSQNGETINFCCSKATQFIVLCCSSPRKTNTPTEKDLNISCHPGTGMDLQEGCGGTDEIYGQ